jgi:hypothetical protein
VKKPELPEPRDWWVPLPEGDGYPTRLSVARFGVDQKAHLRYYGTRQELVELARAILATAGSTGVTRAEADSIMQEPPAH